MVKRYEPNLKEVRGEDPTANMLEWINGDWVEFGDYDALAAELAAVRKTLESDWFSRVTYKQQRDTAHARLRELEATADVRLDALTKAQGRVRELEAALRKLVAACEHGHVSLALLDESKAVLTPAETACEGALTCPVCGKKSCNCGPGYIP